MLLPTDATVLGLAAEDFAREVLRDRMGVRLVVVGENFRFGRGGAGDIGTLRRLVSVTGLDGVELGMVSVGGELVSATRIREHLACGDVDRAGDLLGRPYDVVGRLADTAPPGLIRISPARAVPAPRALPSVGRGRSGRGDVSGQLRSSRSTGSEEGQHCVEMQQPERRCTERDGRPRRPRGVRGQGLMRVLWINAAAELRVMIRRWNGPAAAGRRPDAGRRKGEGIRGG